MLLFGFKQTHQELKVLGWQLCSNCQRINKIVLIKSYNQFELFFIPIFKFSIKYYLICEKCGYGKKISKKEVKELMNQEENYLKEEQVKNIINYLKTSNKTLVDEILIAIKEKFSIIGFDEEIRILIKEYLYNKEQEELYNKYFSEGDL